MTDVATIEAPETAPAAPQVRLPRIGEGVAFYPRTGELRAGKGVHAAIVTAVNEDDRTIDLVVVYDADDFIGMRRIPARIDGAGMGWELTEDNRIAELQRQLEALHRLVFGEHEMAEGDTVLSVLDEHEDRLERLDALVTPVTRVAAPAARASAAPARRAKKKGKKPRNRVAAEGVPGSE